MQGSSTAFVSYEKTRPIIQSDNGPVEARSLATEHLAHGESSGKTTTAEVVQGISDTPQNTQNTEYKKEPRDQDMGDESLVKSSPHVVETIPIAVKAVEESPGSVQIISDGFAQKNDYRRMRSPATSSIPENGIKRLYYGKATQESRDSQEDLQRHNRDLMNEAGVSSEVEMDCNVTIQSKLCTNYKDPSQNEVPYQQGDARFSQNPQVYQNLCDKHEDTSFTKNQSFINDAVLHEKSGPSLHDRISKPKIKKRPKVSSGEPLAKAARNENTVTVPIEHEALLNVMAICLRAGDSKARDIVNANAKAQETTVAVLQETIKQQNSMIDNLKLEKAHLEKKAQSFSESTTRLQKYVKGMEGDYTRLKGQAEIHHNTCTKLVKDKCEKLEFEKSAMLQNFEKTLQTLNDSQRNMRATLSECFNKLMLTDAKNQLMSDQLEIVTVQYKEEKAKRIDLEQNMLPAIQSIQRCLGENHKAVSDKLVVVQRTISGTSGEEQHEDRIKECLDALRGLQANQIISAKGLRTAEGMLQSIHERYVYFLSLSNT